MLLPEQEGQTDKGVSQMKFFWLFLIMCFTIYGPVEITRLIIQADLYPYHPKFESWMYVGELAAMWTCYIGGLTIMYVTMGKK